MDYHDYYGLGVIIVTVIPQNQESYVGKKSYWRDGDETKEITDFQQHGVICARFK
jgi:hypothetical protein